VQIGEEPGEVPHLLGAVDDDDRFAASEPRLRAALLSARAEAEAEAEAILGG
jgi:hypothetical protein